MMQADVPRLIRQGVVSLAESKTVQRSLCPSPYSYVLSHFCRGAAIYLLLFPTYHSFSVTTMESPTPSVPTCSSIHSNPTSPSNARNTPLLECDYDVNPTYLYQAIEAKQWQHVREFLSQSPQAHTQAATWVIRKERDGKLRWRLLPLHAAVIFGSPLEVVEGLLSEYPAAAQCKDDQGMLPLHLCFRNFRGWEILEELLTAYPQGIAIKDRKGRTPLQCASSAFRKPSSVLELYTHVAVTAERQKALRESKTSLEAKIQALQTTHLATLQRLKDDWQVRSDELESELQQTSSAYQLLQQEHVSLKQELEKQQLLERELTSKLSQVTEALTEVTQVEHELEQERSMILTEKEEENAALREMVKELLQNQVTMQETFQQYVQQEEEKRQEHSRQLQVLLEQHEKEENEVPLEHVQREWQEKYQQVATRLAQLSVVQDTNQGETTTTMTTTFETEEEEAAAAVANASVALETPVLEVSTANVTESETKPAAMSALETLADLQAHEVPTTTTTTTTNDTSPWLASPVAMSSTGSTLEKSETERLSADV